MTDRRVVHMFNRSFALLVVLASTGMGSVLTFEGIPDGSPVDAAYLARGLSFSGSTAYVSKAAGGSGDFAGEPSPVTAVFSELGIMVNAPAGLTGPVAFFLSNPYGSTTVRVYAELDGHGLVLSDETLPATAPGVPGSAFSNFAEIVVPYEGIGHSLVIRSRAAGGLFVDDFNLTTADLSVPEPSTFGGALAGTIALAGVRRWLRRRNHDAGITDM